MLRSKAGSFCFQLSCASMSAIMVLVVTLGLPGFQRYAHIGRTALVIWVVYVTSLEGEDEICKRLNLCHIFSVLSFLFLMRAKIGVSILFEGTNEGIGTSDGIAGNGSERGI